MVQGSVNLYVYYILHNYHEGKCIVYCVTHVWSYGHMLCVFMDYLSLIFNLTSNESHILLYRDN